MNVPKLRFKEFNDEWKNIDFKNVFEYFSTNSLSRDQLSDKGTTKNIHYGDIHRKYSSIVDVANDVETYIKDINYNNKYEYCKDSDLIFADASEDYEGIGKVIELDNIKCNTVSGLHTILARDKQNLFAPMFKGYYFNSPSIHNQIRILANGFKVYGISKDSINKLNINIPAKDEQSKIAKTLYLLDKKIELQTKKIEALKLFKKGLILNKMKNDKQWKEYKISDIMNVTRGIVIAKSNISESMDELYKYPVYSSQTSNNGILGYDKTYDFNGQYLTWTTDGANAGKVFYRNGKFRCTNVCGILYNQTNNHISELTAELLNIETPKYVSYVGNPKLMSNVMSDILIKLPDIEEDKYISTLLLKINNKVDLEKSNLNNLIKLKKGLMQSMFV